MYLTYEPLTEEEFRACGSETGKFRHLTAPYCSGAGVDIASQGVPVVPWAIQFDLPEKEFLYYSSGRPPASPIPLRGHAEKLPFVDDSLDFVYSSHFIEDVYDWNPLLNEWLRVLRPGGHLIIMLPDKKLWNEAISKGQPPNCAHRHESFAGELTGWLAPKGVHVLKDELTNSFHGDYNILFVGIKK
jgi:SAM-dependent methyltransferase